ncbi:hypothetical protein [Segatella copri]|uniref:hypothetical protein n=3 Tax=Segatella copri TaxID=165179 RepID=UPI001861ACEA|nr:hypothetical protein [Segatella copri]MBM0155410.1 hypothetical protein [Segatella copri]QNT65652.1 hypothetical protein FO447_03390 [Segatella copri]
MIKIYDINDKLLMQAEVTSAAKREQEMSKSDYISLSFSAAEKVILPIGAYINYTYKIDKVREVTRKFLLLESYEPTQSDECSWKYTPQFQHPKMILSKTPFFIYTRNSQNVEVKQNVWSFVGTTSALSEKIKDFLNKDLMFGECGWKVIFSNVTANTVNVSFSDNDFISALTAITNAIGDNCEWHIDYDDEIIYIGKVLIGATPVVLEVGKNVGVPSINNSKEGYYNAFSIFGGTRNITQVNSKGENVSSGDIRLQLDEGNGTILIDGKERSYSIDKYSTLDLRADKTKEPLFTKVLDFSQIYPSLNTYVYNVRGRVKYVLDDNNKKIPISYNADGSVKEYKTFTVWYMKLAYPATEKVEGKTIINTTVDDGVTHYWYDFEVTDDLLINGKNIGCSFEPNFNTGALSTPLAGRGSNGEYVGFELIYHKEASSSHTSDDVSDSNFSVLAGDYEIIYQEDNEVIIPTNEAEMLIPRGESKPSLKCNITVLYNIAMADTIYYEDAQNRLLEKAKEEIVRLLSDLNNYEVKSYSDVFLEDNPQLQIGQSITYKDGHGYELATRVLKLSTNIDYDFIQSITIGNQVIKGTITQLKEDVQTIIASGGSSGNGGGYSVSQLRKLIAKYGSDNFISKQFDDIAKGTITWEKLQKFLKGMKVGANGDWTLDELDNTHLTTDYLQVRMKAIFETLEILHTDTLGGELFITPVGSNRILKVEEVNITYDGVSQKAYRCYFLGEQDGSKVENKWKVGDQARSKSFNLTAGKYHNVGNHYYWRLVIGVSSEAVEIDGKKYHYVDLSDIDKDAASDEPMVDDILNQCGNRTNITRQSCLVFSAVDTYSPCITLYHGVDGYTFNNKEYVNYGVNHSTNKAFFHVYGDMYFGDRPTSANNYEGESYVKFDSETKKVTIKGELDIKSTYDGKTLDKYIADKRRIFGSQPVPPYDVNDMWVNATYPSDGSTYKNEILKCSTAKAEGEKFDIADWKLASKYTDDTKAEEAKKAAEKAQEEIKTTQSNLNTLGTTVSNNKKAFDDFTSDGYLDSSEIAAIAQDSKRLEDDYNAAVESYNNVVGSKFLLDKDGNETTYKTDLVSAKATLDSAKNELITYLSDIVSRYNASDSNGKATIKAAAAQKYTNFTNAYKAFYDKLGVANNYITSNLFDGLNTKLITNMAGLEYIKAALVDGDTVVKGGLILSTLIALRNDKGNVTAGINGADTKENGIALWLGGKAIDKQASTTTEEEKKIAAKSLLRFDGTGYFANGNLWWDADGILHADPTSFIINKNNVGVQLALFAPIWKSGTTDTTKLANVLSIDPQKPFTHLDVSGNVTTEGSLKIGGIYLSYDSANNALRLSKDAAGKEAANFYALGGITAYGKGAGTTGGGGLNASVISYARIIKGDYTDADLTSIPNAYAIKALSSRIDNIATELGGLNLSWNNITGKPSTFTPSAHTHKWTEITDRITKVSQLTNDKGYLTAHQSLASYYTKAEIDAKGYTTNKGTVTSVALTLPTGLTCATKVITTSGTFAISLASGYSIPTTAKQTAWDGAVSAKHTHSNKSVLDGITSTKVTCWDSAYDWYALITTDEETADGVINKWNEVVSFLANIAQTDTLSGIVDGINKSISDEVTRAKKAEGVNASGISTNKTSITTLQGYFTSGSAKKALQLTNTRKLWGNSFNGTADINGSIIVPDGKYISIGNIKMEYDATNKALKITNTTTNEVANLYTSGGVSAYGVGTSSSSGGGLNGSVKSYSNALKLTSESLSEIASAYSIKALDSRISSLEGGSAMNVSVSGSGNAVTAISKSGTTIIVTKGTTFLTSHQSLASYLTKTDAASLYQPKGNYLTAHQSLDGYVNAIAVSGSGNAVTAVTKSGKTITFTKGSTFSLNGHTHTFASLTSKPTSLSGYGITDGVNAVSVTGSGNAITTASISGHTLTLTKGSSFSLSNHTHYVGTTQVQGSSAEQALTGITKIDNILKLSKASVTVNTSYKAEQNRLVIYGTTYGNDANYIKSAGKLSYGDGGPQLVFSTSDNPDASGVQSAALVYTDHDTIGAGVSLSFVTNQGDAYFIAPHIKALTAFQGNLAWSYITNKPTTLSGFGITDAYTKSQVDAIAAKYLPLTGGTLTGQLKIVASALNGAYNGLRIGDDCYIGDCNIGNTIGLMGVGNNNAGMVKFGKGGMQFGYNGSNHIASTTAQWTNLNADLLDGWHKNNIVWSGAVNSNTASLSHYWAKLFDITVTGNQYDDRNFTFLFSNGFNDTFSVVVLRIRQNGAKDSGAYNFIISLRELVGNMSSRLRVYYNNATGNVQLWGNCQRQYGSLSYTIIKKTGRTSADFTSQGTLVTNISFSAAQSLPATTGDSPYTLLDGATRIGIVNQADQLVTARTIWGQSFNGTANVSGALSGATTISASNTISTTLQNGALKIGNKLTPISAIDAQVIFNTGAAIRFGETAWDWNQWAGLKYTHSNKTIYLGIADNSVFNANSAQSNGTLKFPGITTITPDGGARIGGSGGDLYLGNANNSGFVKVQDMCSQVNSSYWNITQFGSATFKSLTVNDVISCDSISVSKNAVIAGNLSVNGLINNKGILPTDYDVNKKGAGCYVSADALCSGITAITDSIPVDNLSIVYTNDNGRNWTNYNISNDTKFKAYANVAGVDSLYLGRNVITGNTDAEKLAQIKKNELMFSFDIPNSCYSQVYFACVDIGQGVGVTCTVEYLNSKGVIVNTYIKYMTGWNQFNYINLSNGNTAVGVGNDDRRYIRFRFKHDQNTTALRNASINKIRIFAFTKYSFPTDRFMGHTGHIYNFDYNMNTYFPNSILAKGGVTAYQSSDIRLKQDLRKLDYLGIIKAMGGTFSFAWKKDNTRSIGWIAQHVLCNPHLKDIVETDEKGYYKINYWSPKLIATAFGAIEQVGDEVSRLKARVVFLESEVLRLSGDKEDCNKKRLDNKNINSLN